MVYEAIDLLAITLFVNILESSNFRDSAKCRLTENEWIPYIKLETVLEKNIGWTIFI